MKKVIYSFCLFMAAQACTSTESSQHANDPKDALKKINGLGPSEKEHRPSSYCFVLCDFSASQDLQSRDIIRNNALKIFAAAKFAKYQFYDVTISAYLPPFFENTPLTLGNIRKPSELRLMEKKRSIETDTLAQRLIRLSEKPASGQTCIIHAIDLVARTLQASATERDTVRIVILSDMLEDCLYGTTKVDIDHGPFAIAFKKLGALSAPSCTFSKYKNLQIFIAAASQRNVNVNELDQFWKAVFSKYGYDQPFSISPALPTQ